MESASPVRITNAVTAYLMILNSVKNAETASLFTRINVSIPALSEHSKID
jgi:hypothetical protein